MTSISSSHKKPQSAVQRKIAELESALAAERQKAIEAESAKQARYKDGFIDGLLIARIEAEKAGEIYRQQYLDTKDCARKFESLSKQVALDIFSLWLSGESERVKAADGMPSFSMTMRVKVPDVARAS